MKDEIDRMNDAVAEEFVKIRNQPLPGENVCRKKVLGEDYPCECKNCLEKQ
jgi:hypothetical protein